MLAMGDNGEEVATARTDSRDVGTCATCGRPLTQCGPNGECLRCLVSLGFLADGEEAERPAARGRLTPGPLRYAHFEVEVGTDGFPVELGAGAMAITYRARDTVLNSVVALKVIDRSVAQNPGARSRFLREARAAANIHHPHIARVTYYGEQDGECFYAMELIEGETLEARVRRDGPMPLAVALEVIEQAARALAAAEACGVVHRDIKPSNIMLESDASDALRVKLIDYGVAKVMAGRRARPRAGRLYRNAGVASRAVRGSRADRYTVVSTLWALRLVFAHRSLAVCRTPMENPLETRRPVTVGTGQALHLPGQVVALLKSMLAPEPNRPKQRASYSAVRNCYVRFNPEARSRRRRVALLGAAAGVAIAAIALGAWMYQRTRAFTPMERSIAVLPFENLSSDKENAYFAEGIQDEILTRLSKIGDLKVISRTSTQHYKSAPENLRDIARQLGVAHVLEGSVRKCRHRPCERAADQRDSDTHLWSVTYVAR
jgi:serine/threonine-protein kinase